VALKDIELRHLRYFIAVAEECHFGRAASRLLLSQPALSYAIAQLEDRLQCNLVDRANRKRIVVTPAGLMLLDHARKIEELVVRSLAEVRAAGDSFVERESE
jgi:DNA-binding transcriptional LysR family regulator